MPRLLSCAFCEPRWSWRGFLFAHRDRASKAELEPRSAREEAIEDLAKEYQRVTVPLAPGTTFAHPGDCSSAVARVSHCGATWL